MGNRSLPRALVASFATAFFAPNSIAQTCDRSNCGASRSDTGTPACFTPARPVDSRLWGSLRPTDTDPLPRERDTTNFNEFRELYYARRWYHSVEVRSGFVFAGLMHGVAVFDARADPGSPALVVSRIYGPSASAATAFPYVPVGELSKTPFSCFAMPEANDRIAVLGGDTDAGLLVFDLSVRTAPRPTYQRPGAGGDSVYAATIRARNFAFQAIPSGIEVFDLDAAIMLNGCRDDVPAACPGVYLGRFSDVSPAHIHGDGELLAVTHSRGVSVFDVTNPPQFRLRASQPLLHGQPQGLAMWSDGARRYLAVRYSGDRTQRAALHIYDMGCLNTTCPTFPDPLFRGEYLLSTEPNDVTFSRSGTTPFLYLGHQSTCFGADGLQREWLLDVGDPRRPRDVTPQGTVNYTGFYGEERSVSVNYWSWYGRSSPTGFQLVAPARGKFFGRHFYRAARSLLDVHFWTPTSIDAGTADAVSDVQLPTEPTEPIEPTDVTIIADRAIAADATNDSQRTPSTSGCACRITHTNKPGVPWGAALLLAAAAVTMRRAQLRRRSARPDLDV